MKALNPDQDTAVDFALNTDGCNIFARPGKGKTRIALETIYSTQARTLIIAPLLPAMTSWPNENKKWGFNFDMRVLHGKEKKVGDEQVSIINYDGLPWLKKQDLSSYDYVIYDEVHNLKNAGTSRFRNWRKPCQQFKYRLGLTGTPRGNHLKALWGEMFVVDFGETLGRTLHGPKGFYSKWFFPDPRIPGVYNPIHGAEEEILATIKPRAISLDFFDDEMPELTHVPIEITLPFDVREAYKQMHKHKIVKKTDIIAVNAGVKSNKLRQMAAGAVYDANGDIIKMHNKKAVALKNLVEELQGDPLIVFIQFKHDVAACREVLGKNVPVIDGNTSALEMVDIINRWNAGEIPVLVAEPSKAGVGGNMQEGGNNICFYTVPWSLTDIEQAIGRVWRQGQESEQCIVYYLQCVDTKDDEVIEAAQNNKQDQDALFTALSHN